MRAAARGALRFAGVGLVLATASGSAHGQEPPPPPTNLPPQYVPPPTPSQVGPGPTPPPVRREPPRRDRERERERERERDREPPPVRRAPPPPPPSAPRDEPPPAARGFQMALRTGLSLPLGDISGQQGDSMSHDFALQVPLFVEIGLKVHPMVFIGAYTSLSLGSTSSAFSTAQGCDKSARSCLASTFRIGVEVQIHFQPAELVDPWVGYGIGLESASASANGGGIAEASESFTGLEPARLAGGVDFRLSRLFGIGPFAELAFGNYTHAHVQFVNGQTQDGPINNTALHVWPTIGVRGVFFP